MSEMKAVRIHAFGGPEALSVERVERPDPAPEEVLVRLRATSVNPVDFKTREGKFPPVDGSMLPFVLGRDIAGTVEQCGSAVDDVPIGAAVFGMPSVERGSYAEFALLRRSELAAVPDGLAMNQAGVTPLAALTAWQGLFAHGELQAGQRVLIHGGSGGVGHFAIQFARAHGASVFATASARNLDFLRELGAETAIDYRSQRFEDVVEEIDLVLDLIGGDTLARSWAVLRAGGGVVSALGEPDPDLAKAAGARIATRFMALPSADDMTRIAAMMDDGTVRATISETYELDRVAEAQKRLEAGGVRGKIAVTVG